MSTEILIVIVCIAVGIAAFLIAGKSGGNNSKISYEDLDTERVILKYAKQYGKVTTNDVSRIFNISYHSAKAELLALKKAGKLKHKGKGSASRYELK